MNLGMLKSLPVGWRRDGNGSGECKQRVSGSRDLQKQRFASLADSSVPLGTHTHTYTQMLRIFSAYTALPLDTLI